MYNMYALAAMRGRLRRVTVARPRRENEFDALAPIRWKRSRAMELLEIWTAQAQVRRAGQVAGESPSAELGRRLLLDTGVGPPIWKSSPRTSRTRTARC